MKDIVTTIRWILTVFLILGAYTETGIWTCISLFLIFIAIEIMNWTVLHHTER